MDALLILTRGGMFGLDLMNDLQCYMLILQLKG